MAILTEEHPTTDAYVADLRRLGPLLSREDEIRLAQAVEAGGPDGLEARNRLVTSNLRLVISIAKRHQGHGLELDDLIQAGNLGLMTAAVRFDWRLGWKFSTYATAWIRQAITRAIMDQGSTIRIPVHLREVMFRIERARGALTLALGRDPTASELAASTGDSERSIRNALEVTQQPVSLSLPVKPEAGSDEAELVDFVGDPDADVPGEAESRARREACLREVRRLLPRERYIIARRCGLDGRPPATLDEVGRELHITRERVRQLEGHAIRRLRQGRAAANLSRWAE